MRLRSLGIIGGGTIALSLADILSAELAAPLERVVCLTGQESCAAARGRLAALKGKLAREISVETDCTALLEKTPDLVIECASHGAVADHGAAVLAAGIDLVIVSTGALGDAALHARLLAAARKSGARLILSHGAVGGVDALSAARISGITEVVYTSRKPPLAWRGTRAEALLDLGALKCEAVFYEGNARGAAQAFPKNANVAATIALAGLGFERTRVRLIADPAAPGNVHEFQLRSACADIDIRIVGKPSPDNPKTSLSTVYALAREVLNRTAHQAV